MADKSRLCIVKGLPFTTYCRLLTLYQETKFWTCPKTRSLQTTILNLLRIAESSQNKEKTLWEKGEIARYEQFLLFPQGFLMTCTADT